MKSTKQVVRQAHSILLLLVLLFSSHPALALSLGFNVKAGIDSETLRFLESYPENVRKEAVLGVTQVLDRADVSVSKVFLQGRDFIFLVTDAAVCVQRNLKAVPQGMFAKIFGINAVYSRDVDKALNKLANSTRLTTAPDELVKGYVVIDVVASDGQCLTMQSDLDQRELVRQRAVLNTSYLLWKRLEGVCKNLGECYALIRATVEGELENAVRQDKDRIKADERMARIRQAPESRTFKLTKDYDLFHYERAINGMLEIHDDLMRVSNVRITSGFVVKDQFDMALKGLLSSIKGAEDTSDWVASCNQGYKLAPQLTAVSNLQESLAGFEIMSAQEMEELKASIKLASDRSNKLVSRKDGDNGFRNNGKSCFWYVPKIPKFPTCKPSICM